MRTRSILLTCLSLSLVGLCACQPSEKPSAKVKASAPERAQRPTLSEVTDARTDLLFIYQGEKGEELRAVSIPEIPEDKRAQVQVIDLSRSPAERSAGGYLQFFDLRQADSEGRYMGRLISRAKRDQELASEQALPAQPPIVLYTTSWCGVCKKARRFMESQGWAFVEKDIEKDTAAKRELEQKARRAQLSLGGVPVIDVGGRLMSGFDQASLVKLVTGS